MHGGALTLTTALLVPRGTIVRVAGSAGLPQWTRTVALPDTGGCRRAAAAGENRLGGPIVGTRGGV
jgi:hypothetical protein